MREICRTASRLTHGVELGCPESLWNIFWATNENKLWNFLKISKAIVHLGKFFFKRIYWGNIEIVRAKSQVSKCHEFQPFQYDKKHSVYLGVTKLAPSHKRTVNTRKSIVEAPQ